MADKRPEMSPTEQFRALLEEITPEQLAEIDGKLDDPDFVPREGAWRDDPDPFGRNWDWLLQGPKDEEAGGGSSS